MRSLHDIFRHSREGNGGGVQGNGPPYHPSVKRGVTGTTMKRDKNVDHAPIVSSYRLIFIYYNDSSNVTIKLHESSHFGKTAEINIFHIFSQTSRTLETFIICLYSSEFLMISLRYS